MQKESKKIAKETLHAVEAMLLMVEIRDLYTAQHQRQVSRLARSIAEKMSLPEDRIEAIEMAASVHDLGKIYVPAEILGKPGRLTDTELDMIRVHPQIGYNVLKIVDFLWPIARIVYQHHERMDGSGYPLGLSGKDLLLESRIIAVADVAEAVLSHRPYRPALGMDMLRKEFSRNSDLSYDQEVVKICLDLLCERQEAFIFGV